MSNKKKLVQKLATASMLFALGMPLANTAVNLNQTVHATTQSTFLNKAARQAQRAAKKYGLYPSVMIAQAIVESAWGQSTLATRANNLFGLKADDNWTGQVYTARTREENSKGKSYYITAKFRKYSNFEGSFDDNGKKLRLGVSWQPLRYQKAWIENAKNPSAATKALTGTYATDHRYNLTLNERITTYNLTKYDPIISTAKHTYYVSKNTSSYAWPTDHSISAVSDSLKKKQKVTVDKTITYYDGSKRMHIKNSGWVDGNVLTSSNKTEKKTSKTSTKLLMHNAFVYDDHAKRIRGKFIRGDREIRVYGKKKIKGHYYYVIAKNQNVAAGNIDGTLRVLSHNSYIYNGSGNRDNALLYRKKRMVATYGSPITIMHKTYYKIGIHQFIKTANFLR